MILAANRCNDRSPNLYVADSLSEIADILNPRVGDVAMLISEGVFESWRLTEAAGTADGYSLIDSNACEFQWNHAGSIYNVIALGAVGDGVTDDTEAIQRAVNFAEASGGEVYFPTPGRYRVTNEITISSKYPVVLRSSMEGYNRNGLTPSTSCILLGASIAGSIFKYTYPTARAESGGGAVIGLAFRDETAALGEAGSYTITAALELFDFNFSQVKDCYFWNLNGSAIKTNFTVQTEIVESQFHYCGAAGKPTIWLSLTNSSFVTQSLTMRGCKVEACLSDDYIRMDNGISEIKITSCAFEADTSKAASSQNFLDIACSYVIVDACSFNRNNATQINLQITSSNVSIASCGFRGSPNATPAVVLGGSHGSVMGCKFNTGKSGDEILVTGSRNSVSGNSLINAGAITCTGSGNNVLNNILQQGFVYSSATWWITLDDECCAIGNTIVGFAGHTAGGILAAGTTPRVIGNSLSHIDGTAIRCESVNATITANVCHTNGSDFDDAATTQQVYANYFANVPYLEKTEVVVPGLIAAGASYQTTVTGVTRAVVGDAGLCGFTSILPGVSMSAVVIANGQVQVTFRNETALGITLLSGALKVRVIKATI